MNILEKLKEGETTASSAETESLAGTLAAFLPKDWTLALYGDLGTGKTTFVRGLARGWGIQAPVTSPSYTIISIYHGERTLVHMDAYRLENKEQVDALMLEEFLISPYCLAIEWPENLGSWLPADCWRLCFTIMGENRHRIQLEEH